MKCLTLYCANISRLQQMTDIIAIINIIIMFYFLKIEILQTFVTAYNRKLCIVSINHLHKTKIPI